MGGVTREARSHGGLNPVLSRFVLDRALTGSIIWKIRRKHAPGEKWKFWDFGIAGSLSVLLLLETPYGRESNDLAHFLDSSKSPDKTE